MLHAYQVVYIVVVILTCGFTYWAGGQAERTGLIIVVSASLASYPATVLFRTRWTQEMLGDVAIDSLTTIAFFILMAKSPGVLADLELRLLSGDDDSSCDAMDAARRSGVVLLRHHEPLGLSSRGIDLSGSGLSSVGEVDRALLTRLLGGTRSAQDIADVLLASWPSLPAVLSASKDEIEAVAGSTAAKRVRRCRMLWRTSRTMRSRIGLSWGIQKNFPPTYGIGWHSNRARRCELSSSMRAIA